MSGLTRRHRKQRTVSALSQFFHNNFFKTEKPPALCQCQDEKTRKPCPNLANPKSLFCSNHQMCKPAPKNGYEPKYNPDRYNSDPSIYKSHNCYSYSMDVVDPLLVKQCRNTLKKNTCRQSFHQPGALNGDRYTLNIETRRTCPVVEKLMISDVPEVSRSSFYGNCPIGKSKIALVVDPGEDYHYYRMDNSEIENKNNQPWDKNKIKSYYDMYNIQPNQNLWSHKDGSNKVKRYDALKRPIVNPQLASRDYRWQGSDLNYEDFCGFYCVPRETAVHLGQGGASKKKKTRKAVKAVKAEKAEKAVARAKTRRLK